MKEETNNPNYKVGQVLLAQDGNDTTKVLGCITKVRKVNGEWVYNVLWDDNEYGDEPYKVTDIDNFFNCLQTELNS